MKLFWIGIIYFLSFGEGAISKDIATIYDESKTADLQKFSSHKLPDDAPSAIKIRNQFTLIKNVQGDNENSVQLLVINGPIYYTQSIFSTIILSEEWDNKDTDEILFVLCHELGHIILGHASEQKKLYAKYIPGEVTPESSRTPEALEGYRKLSSLAQYQEFAADKFAVSMLIKLGKTKDNAIQIATNSIREYPTQGDATHPSTLKRVMALMYDPT